MIQLILLSIAAAALLLDLIFTIHEVILYYHVNYSFAAHPGRIRGSSEARAQEGEAEDKREVEWIVKNGSFLYKEGSDTDEG